MLERLTWVEAFLLIALIVACVIGLLVFACSLIEWARSLLTWTRWRPAGKYRTKLPARDLRTLTGPDGKPWPIGDVLVSSPGQCPTCGRALFAGDWRVCGDGSYRTHLAQNPSWPGRV